MLSLYIGYPKHLKESRILRYPTKYVTQKMSNSEILISDIGIRMLKECSAIDVIYNQNSFKTIDGELIGVDKVSGGVHALMCMLETDYWIDMCKCGDNCNKYVAEISRMKDLHIYTTRYYNPFNECQLDKVYVVNTDMEYFDGKEFIDDIEIHRCFHRIGE